MSFGFLLSIIIAPSPPSNIKVDVLSSYELNASWDLPAETNGVITEYVVAIYKKGEEKDLNNTYHTKLAKSKLFKALKPYTYYIVEVQASTKAGRGNWSNPVETRTYPERKIDPALFHGFTIIIIIIIVIIIVVGVVFIVVVVIIIIIIIIIIFKQPMNPMIYLSRCNSNIRYKCGFSILDVNFLGKFLKVTRNFDLTGYLVNYNFFIKAKLEVLITGFSKCVRKQRMLSILFFLLAKW